MNSVQKYKITATRISVAYYRAVFQLHEAKYIPNVMFVDASCLFYKARFPSSLKKLYETKNRYSSCPTNTADPKIGSSVIPNERYFKLMYFASCRGSC